MIQRSRNQKICCHCKK